MLKFERSDGTLTVYALRCGYVQRREFGQHEMDGYRKVELYREFDCYHVRQFERVDGTLNRRWESFPVSEYPAARRMYAQMLREVRDRD